MVGLGTPAIGGYFVPNDTSADGTVAVGISLESDPLWQALIWDSNEGNIVLVKEMLQTKWGLDLTGWTLLNANGISADGLTIVGDGGGPNGTQGWRAALEYSHFVYIYLTINVIPGNVGIDTISQTDIDGVYPPCYPAVVNAEDFIDCPDIWRFDHWEGDVVDPNSSRTTVIMTENKTITAVFVLDQRRCGDECHPLVQGDIDGDCYVEFEDYAIYADERRCGQECPPVLQADLDQDGDVDLEDLGIYAGEWLNCSHPDCD